MNQKKRIFLTRRSRAYWRLSFDRSWLNAFGPEVIWELDEIVTAIESDEQVKAVVIDCGIEGFLLTHLNQAARLEDGWGAQQLPGIIARFRSAPVISIASIRGRAIGIGSALALASDMGFASREKAIFSPWKLGAGQVPGSDQLARLLSMTGRGRALEVLLGADDIEGDLAERYGYVNRSLPDLQLDEFIEDLATRIAALCKYTIAESKRLIVHDDRPASAGFWPKCDTFVVSSDRSAANHRLRSYAPREIRGPESVESR